MKFEKNLNAFKESLDKKKVPAYETVEGIRIYERADKPAKDESCAKEQESEIRVSRRGFLKAILGLGGAALAGTAAVKSIEKTTEFANKVFKDQEEGNTKEGGMEEQLASTTEQAEINKEDFITTAEILDFDKPERIEFNLGTVERIKNGWKRKYREKPELRNSFIRAYREMGFWQPYLEEIFNQEGVPKDYIFLAIPESHWQLKAVSPAGAVGPYQFMRKTAQMYGLKVERNLDERKDPLASARACAKLLRDLRGRTNDWNLALSGYNGGFLWRYIKERTDQDKKPAYEDYLRFVEDILNNKKEKIKNLVRRIKVRSGDSWEKIANRHGCSPAQLTEINKGQIGGLIAGQTLKMPFSESQKKKIYEKTIRGYSENVNYPAKFYAIKELIDEKFVTEQEVPITFREKKFIQPEIRYNLYKIIGGDTLFGLSRRFKIKSTDIVFLNPQLKLGLKAGQKIKIPIGQPRLLSLREVADKTGRPLERLIFLNPAIKPDASFPEMKVRI